MVIRRQVVRKGRRPVCPPLKASCRLRPCRPVFCLFRRRRPRVSFSGPRPWRRPAFSFLASGSGAGAALAEPPFILSSMHLLTTSARLSSDMLVAPFSVDIQHCSAARVRVIGGSGAVAVFTGALVPVVSHPASARPASAISSRRGMMRVVDVVIGAFSGNRFGRRADMPCGHVECPFIPALFPLRQPARSARRDTAGFTLSCAA